MDKKLIKLGEDCKKQFYTYTKMWGIIPEATKKAYDSFNFSLDNFDEQMFIKRIWSVCAVEELSEMYHAGREGDNDHYKEEAIDFFNFCISGFIAMGDEPFPKDKEFWVTKTDWEDGIVLDKGLWEMADAIHYATNKLKSRPWTQANFKVDRLKFDERSEKIFGLMWTIIAKVFASQEDFLDHFYRKYKVNMDRIRTGY
jgi:hypothetical protein